MRPDLLFQYVGYFFMLIWLMNGLKSQGPSMPDVFSDEEEEERQEITLEEDFQYSETRSPPRKRTRTDGHHRRTPTPEARPHRRDLSERNAVPTKIRRISSGEENVVEGKILFVL